MMRKVLALLLCAAPLQAADGPGTLVSEGQSLMKQGDYESAVLKLDEAARLLATDPTRTRLLADAYLYLGISYVELNQELNARGKFKEVLRKEPQRLLSDAEYSQQVIRVFEAARLELYPKKKNRFVPLLLIAGGGTAAAGVAVAASSGEDTPTTATTVPSTSSSTPLGGGGGNPTPTPTTVVIDPGNPTRTPTPTTLPEGTPTPVGQTATPSPTPAGATATPTPTPTTVAPTATPTPTCSYTLSPPSTLFPSSPVNGTCNVATQASCPWTANADQPWINIQGPDSGNGNGSVNYHLPAVGGSGQRTGRIRISQAPSQECVIVQGMPIPDPGVAAPAGELTWESTLDVEAGRGQVVVDGQSVRYQERGREEARIGERPGPRHVVAHLVSAKGRPGTWTFRLTAAVPGSLRPVAGDVLQVTPDQITFRLAGQPGERVVFTFEAAR